MQPHSNTNFNFDKKIGSLQELNEILDKTKEIGFDKASKTSYGHRNFTLIDPNSKTGVRNLKMYEIVDKFTKLADEAASNQKLSPELKLKLIADIEAKIIELDLEGDVKLKEHGFGSMAYRDFKNIFSQSHYKKLSNIKEKHLFTPEVKKAAGDIVNANKADGKFDPKIAAISIGRNFTEKTEAALLYMIKTDPENLRLIKEALRAETETKKNTNIKNFLDTLEYRTLATNPKKREEKLKEMAERAVFSGPNASIGQIGQTPIPQTQPNQPKNAIPASPAKLTLTELPSQQGPSRILDEISTAINETNKIDADFTTKTLIADQIKAHEEAKTFLSENLAKLGAKTEFIKAPESAEPIPLSTSIELNDFSPPIDKNVFTWQITQGVTEDIKKDGKRTDDSIVLYAVASQFNGCEAPNILTIPPGQAVTVYQNDKTQGPQAQLAFGAQQVELINCGGNKGYNALSNVLTDSTKDAIKHGYLMPEASNIKQVVKELQTKSHLVEYPCISNKPIDGEKPVHQILVSTVATGYANVNLTYTPEMKEAQFACALTGFRAQFKKALDESKDGKQVVLNAVAVGLGAFDNDPEIVAKAFYTAAKEFENDLLKNNVKVRLQIYKAPNVKEPTGKAVTMKNFLNLTRHIESQVTP